MWANAVLAGGFALAGVTLQHLFAQANTRHRSRSEFLSQRREERHLAMVNAVKAGRRVQRALVDAATGANGVDERYSLEHAVNALTEAVVTVRVVVDSDEVISAFRELETKAKELQLKPPSHIPSSDSPDLLRLSPVIKAIQQYEANG